MKIEKINDNQIRCTLTHADLVERQLHLSELAYGSEKAKSLFHDMMQQAAYEFGFETDDLPLMIEAMPAGGDTIVLIITKVDNPEELDRRFSRFSSSATGDNHTTSNEPPGKLEGAETLMNLLEKMREKMDAVVQKESESSEKAKESVTKEPENTLRLFSFSTMDHVLQAARLLNGIYFGSNTLYKDNAENVFVLAMTQSEHSRNDFNRICNMLTEYGTLEKSTSSMLAFLEEHCDLIVSTNAMQELALI